MPPLISKVKAVQLPNLFSDGNVATHPPANDGKLFADTESKLFHRGLAKMWYEKKGLPIPPGVSMEFASLPAGYAVYSCIRTDTDHIDRYLYGLHAGRFRSSNEYFPHFEYLMGNASAACKCRFCNRKKVASKMKPGERSVRSACLSTSSSRKRPSVPQTSEASASAINKRKRNQPQGRKAYNKWNDQYTGSPAPDVNDIEQRWNAINNNCLSVLLRDLERSGVLQRPLKSTDIPPSLYHSWADLEQQSTWNSSKPQWCPRRGEVVFYVEGMNVKTDHIGWDIENQRFVMVQSGLVDRKKIEWEIGLVVQPPQVDKPNLQALSSMTDSLAGVYLDDQVIGIKRLSGSINSDKSNDDVCWVLISQMRHLSEHTQVLNGLSSESCKIPLRFMQKIFKSVAPWGQYQFEGRWPRAIISCKGVWVEGELIQIGDAAWVRNDKSEDNSEVIVVSYVEMQYKLISHNSVHNTSHGSQVQSVRIAVIGQVYSMKPSRLMPGQPAIRNSRRLPKAMQGYVWFPVAADDAVVFAESIKGRLYERDCYEIMYRRNPDGPQLQSCKRSLLDKGKSKATTSLTCDDKSDAEVASQPNLGPTWRICNHRDEQLGINLGAIFKDYPNSNHAEGEVLAVTSSSSDELGREGVFA